MVICHSNKLLSSTKPAENPSTGLLVSSANAKMPPHGCVHNQAVFLEGVLQLLQRSGSARTELQHLDMFLACIALEEDTIASYGHR